MCMVIVVIVIIPMNGPPVISWKDAFKTIKNQWCSLRINGYTRLLKPVHSAYLTATYRVKLQPYSLPLIKSMSTYTVYTRLLLDTPTYCQYKHSMCWQDSLMLPSVELIQTFPWKLLLFDRIYWTHSTGCYCICSPYTHTLHSITIQRNMHIE